MHIARRKTRQISVGNVKIGGGAPVSVQSMCSTDTRDVVATIAQIHELEAAAANSFAWRFQMMRPHKFFRKLRRL